MAKKLRPPAASRLWSIRCGDCTQQLSQLPAGEVQLIVADPPYNIGREGYDVYEDKKPVAEYLTWTRGWVEAARQALHKHGTLWIAIYDNLVSEVDVLVKELGFYKRGHIIWAFTFGVNQPNNFTRSKVHWLYYTRAKTKFTFQSDDPALRIPSLRAIKYNDKRADPSGRLPNDLWVHHLEPHTGDADVWVHSRVCGTYRERVPGMDNQLPEIVVERILRATSKPNDLVCDPFGGTFTTGAVALRLGRRFIGFDISQDYCQKGELRLQQTLAQKPGAIRA